MNSRYIWIFQDLEKHELLRHGNLSCPECKRVFNRPVDLACHLKSLCVVHCYICGKRFEKKTTSGANSRLKSHLKHYHFSEGRREKPKKYKCKWSCGEAFKCKRSLGKHEANCPSTAISCPFCPMKFTKKMAFAHHRRTCPPRPINYPPLTFANVD